MFRSFFLLGLAAVLLGNGSAHANHDSVRTMCAEADAIVLARVKKGDRATVEKWLLPPSKGGTAPQEIEIDGLAAHRLDPSRYISNGDKPERLAGERFVAFLQSTNSGWKPLSKFPIGDQVGSEGIVWIQDGKCWVYVNDFWYGGLYPFVVIPSRAYYVRETFESPADESALLNEITAGITEAREWHEAVADQDPGRKAEKLAAYYLASTSPTGAEMTFAGKISDHLLPLEEKAVPAMAAALSRIQPGDDPDFLLRGLLKINADTREATPALVRLLSRPDLSPPQRVLEALQHTRDPRMAPFLSSFLFHWDGEVRKAALGALDSITCDTLTPTQRVADSPFIALLLVTENTSVSSKIPIRIIQRLKGELPHRFTLEQIDPSIIAGREYYIAFLRQDDQGRFIPAEGEWLKRYNRFTECVFWNTHWIPLEDLVEAIRPRQAGPIRPELAEKRARWNASY